jgi:hypothetical protein
MTDLSLYVTPDDLSELKAVAERVIEEYRKPAPRVTNKVDGAPWHTNYEEGKG